VRAGDRDALLQPHQLGEHQRARHDRDVALARFGDLGVVVLDRARDDDGVGARDMPCVVPDMNFRAARAQPLGRALDATSEPLTLYSG
jgi:hypothetical protein